MPEARLPRPCEREPKTRGRETEQSCLFVVVSERGFARKLCSRGRHLVRIVIALAPDLSQQERKMVRARFAVCAMASLLCALGLRAQFEPKNPATLVVRVKLRA